MVIRKGKISDISDMATLLIHSWRTHYTFLPKTILTNLNVDHQIQRHTILFKGDSNYIVCEIDKRLAAFSSYGPSRSGSESESESGGQYELYTLYVHPHFQRQGIGSLLVKNVLTSISTNSIYVEVMEQNPFKSFYENLGFQVINKTKMNLDGHNIPNLIYFLDQR